MSAKGDLARPRLDFFLCVSLYFFTSDKQAYDMASKSKFDQH